MTHVLYVGSTQKTTGYLTLFLYVSLKISSVVSLVQHSCTMQSNSQTYMNVSKTEAKESSINVN